MERITTDELEARLGAQLRALRIAAELDQRALAERANVSVGAVQGLERGGGSTIRTLIRVVRALDRDDWLATLDPVGDVPSPLEQLRAERGEPRRRQRVRRRAEPERDR